VGPTNDGIAETHTPDVMITTPHIAGHITTVWCHMASHDHLHVYADVPLYKCLPSGPIHYSLTRPTPIPPVGLTQHSKSGDGSSDITTR